VILLRLLLCLLASVFVSGFQPTGTAQVSTTATRQSRESSSSLSWWSNHPTLLMAASSSNNNKEKPEYSRDIYLREEAESPFRKVRIFFYYSVGAGALLGLAISSARVLAALNGINADLLQESATNVVIDLAGLALIAFLYKRDMEAQESRLQRASKGAELAKLLVRASTSISTGLVDADSDKINESKVLAEAFTTSLASLRRGRGIEKRVVIAAAGSEKIRQVIQEARRLDDALSFNDLLIVPIVLPTGSSPKVPVVEGEALPECIALPVGAAWRSVINDESVKAIEQGVDIEKDGFCVILKKNGRVGQRTKGIFLENMVADVTQRFEMGMDIKNI
jgi:Low psii accumulation1 / Rep27